VLFRSDFTVTGLRLWPRGDEGAPDYPLAFDYGTLRVELAPPTDTEEEGGYSRDTGVGSATLERTPPRKVGPMFEAVGRGEFPEGSNPDCDSDYFDEATGRPAPNSVLPLDIMPPAFIDFAHEVRQELWSFALRTVRVLRWRLDHEGPHNPFATRGDFWSFDGASWQRMPHEVSLSMQQLWPLASPEAALRDVATIVDAGGDEPLSHQLFREGLLQRNENPRSALVIGVSAVEVAVKECIAALDPLSTWLVQHLPTPPINRILSEYIPTLPAVNKIDEKVLPPPKNLLDELQKAIGWRNRVTHGGHLEVSADRVANFLELTAHDIMWLLTYYAGAHWALDNMTNETRVALGLPELHDLRRGRAIVSVIRRPLL
jgi:hypothetical protein